MSRSFTYAATLTWGGDIQTGEAEVECSYTVTWGAPEQGPSYASGGQPADPDEIDDVRILRVDGKPWPVDMSSGHQTAAQDHEMLIEKLLADCYDDMIAEAVEWDTDDRARYDEDRREDDRWPA